MYNFPLLVRLDSTNFDFTQAIDSSDVRFARADGTHLLYQKERWDSTNKVAELWVLVDTVRSGQSSQYITMYWGKNGVFSKSNPNRVFDTANGFAGVWHLANSNFNDATPNNNTAANTGTTDTSAVIATGRKFVGTDPDYLQYRDSWVRPPR